MERKHCFRYPSPSSQSLSKLLNSLWRVLTTAVDCPQLQNTFSSCLLNHSVTLWQQEWCVVKSRGEKTPKRTHQNWVPFHHDKVKLNIPHIADGWPLPVKEDILEDTCGITCCISRGISHLQWSRLVLKLHKVSKSCKLMFYTNLLEAFWMYKGIEEVSGNKLAALGNRLFALNSAKR